MEQLSTLYLMVHPTPRNSEKVKTFFERWENYLAQAASDPQAALCVLSNSPPEMNQLKNIVTNIFGQRCFMDPLDTSQDTQLKYIDTINNFFKYQGMHSKYGAYGMSTAKNALYWTQGLKLDLRQQGYNYSPETLQVIGFGAMWGGCMTKYTALMSHYLGVEKTPVIMPELCHDAGFPVNGRYLEKKQLDNHVWAFLFQAANGAYFAQFMESLRPIWQPHKRVLINAEKNNYFVQASPYNGYINIDASSIIQNDNTIEFPVMDGYASPNVTLFSRNDDYESFKQSMFNAKVDAEKNQAPAIRLGLLPYQAPADLDNFC